MIEHRQPDRETPASAIGMASLLDLDGLSVAERSGHSVISIEALLHRRVLYGEARYLADRVLPPHEMALSEGSRGNRLLPAAAAWVRAQQHEKRLISSIATDQLVQRLAERLAADVGCQYLLQHGDPDAIIHADDFRYDRHVVAHVDWLVRQPTRVFTVELRSVDDLSEVADTLRAMHYCRRVAWSQWLVSQEYGLPLAAVTPVILAVERHGDHRVRLFGFTAADLAEGDRRNQDALERLAQPDEQHPVITIVTDPFAHQIPRTTPLMMDAPPADAGRRRKSRRSTRSMTGDDQTLASSTNSMPISSQGSPLPDDAAVSRHLEPAPESVAVLIDESIDPEGTDVFGPLDLGTPKRRHHGDALDRIVTEHGESS